MNPANQGHSIHLDIINRGFSRLDASQPPYQSRNAPETVANIVGFISLPKQIDVWEHLQWWESPLNAESGIKALCKRPYLQWKNNQDAPSTYFPTRMLYPYSIQSSESDRIRETAKFISASVRQGRELYMAAEAAGTSDLSKPQLYFYGALSLAQAVSQSLFGVQNNLGGHGLVIKGGPTMNDPTGSNLPTIIQWKQEGDFANFYRAARYDEIYADSLQNSLWNSWKNEEKRDRAPKIHILECIRCMNYNWGILPITGLEMPADALSRRKLRELLLMQYHGSGSDIFQTRNLNTSAKFIEVPAVIILYMILFYFSVLSRYHIIYWQELLSGTKDPEGFVFRIALAQAANDFLYQVVNLLPLSSETSRYLGPVEWEKHKPDWNKDYQALTDDIVSPFGFSFPLHELPEW